jgi:hypothetical protein
VRSLVRGARYAQLRFVRSLLTGSSRFVGARRSASRRRRGPGRLLDVDVRLVTRLLVLVAADRFAGGSVDVGEPVVRDRTSTACTVEDAMPSRSPISTGPSRSFHRTCTILRTTSCEVRLG